MTTLQRVEKFLEKIKKEDKEINAFLQIRDEKELIEGARAIDAKIGEGKAGKLAGKVIAVKANINVHGMNASCASKVLENYTAPYDAAVVSKIKEEDGLIIGITNMDEFACGFSGETSAFGPTKNPLNKKLITGGSSSGSAAAVAAGFCDMALGSDTGGSIRNPASICGVVGLKPSYGSVSRYGLIDLSMSLDQIGPIAGNVEDAALLLDVIRGRDTRDSISIDSEKLNLKKIKEKPKGIRIGVLNLDGLNVDENVKNLINERVNEISKKNGWDVKNVQIKNLDLAVETYYPLVYVEFFSGTRRFDGRRYGKKIEDFAGPEVLRRILGGSEITKAEHKGRYYDSALKVKNFFAEEFKKIFKEVDCVVCPTLPRLPWKIGEKISVEDGYAMDVLTIPPNLAGNCAVSVPAGAISLDALPSAHPPAQKDNGVPVGLQIICDKFQEEKLLRIAKGFE
ncbi:MAG: Asp-tRNA(Asn)/Glu-tRNA(Gln) amidotransferase subunit GatA [Nanoarchaeota archaeon]|nr:Asp-tRNA(Asn)/Glu-tRNA(Gln) amidotransferase subunit GatA [Nanoarchaeota archaeon]MBU1501451.1 Asp-tRNA(Asn)/Glu-tRNA(Gln) amidotransferase subunit GatA [Nanoarchaeota archaeon]MBU2459207.1 Asp-tRNA(Asn)/Glu-tRNA(Gln) amidotransferase subunit GatA [Nanoarchaeota archaeon]